MTEEAHQTEPERPIKRIRLSSSEQDSQVDTQLQKELKAGITAYVSPDIKGFSGTLKQRYTDFQVNEILPDGRVLHLEGDDLPAADMAESTRNGTVENKSGGEKKSNDYGTSETRSEQSNAEHTSVVVSDVEEDAAETVENGDQSHKEVLQSYYAGLRIPLLTSSSSLPKRLPLSNQSSVKIQHGQSWRYMARY